MEDKRQHLSSGLAARSLVNAADLEPTRGAYRAIVPDFTLVLVSGSVFDAGADVLRPFFDAVAACRAEHRLGVTVGGGVRERHTYRIGISLGLPIGGLATIVGAVGEQNALVAWACLSEAGAMRMNKATLEMLPFVLDLGKIPVLVAYPPYHYWEYPDADTLIPTHGPDCGALMLAETLGCKLIIVKDVDGIHDRDPNDYADTKRFDRVSAGALRAAMPATFPLEKAALDIFERSKNIRRFHVISARRPQDLAAALRGETVGTVVERDDA